MRTEEIQAGDRAGERACPRCGVRFVCGMEAGHEKCWCAELPPMPIDPHASGCFCPACLNEIIAQRPDQASG